MQDMEHELEVTTQLHELCSEYERQMEEWVQSILLSIDFVFFFLSNRIKHFQSSEILS